MGKWMKIILLPVAAHLVVNHSDPTFETSKKGCRRVAVAWPRMVLTESPLQHQTAKRPPALEEDLPGSAELKLCLPA